MNQTDRVVAALKREPLTQLKAYQKLGITRLGARIWDLEEKGVKIKKRWVEVKDRFGDTCRVKEYSL